MKTHNCNDLCVYNMYIYLPNKIDKAHEIIIFERMEWYIKIQTKSFVD